MFADGPVLGDVFFLDGGGFGPGGGGALTGGGRGGPPCGQRPMQIDGGRAGGAEGD